MSSVFELGGSSRIQYRADELEPGEQRVWAFSDTRMVIERLHDTTHAPWVVVFDGELDNAAFDVMRALEQSAGQRLAGGGKVNVVGKSEHKLEHTPDGLPDIVWSDPSNRDDALYLTNLVADLVVLRPRLDRSDDERQAYWLGQSRYLIRDLGLTEEAA